MPIAPTKLDLLATSGTDALKALLKYHYDVDVDFTAVTIDKTNVTVGLHGVNEDRAGLVEITAKPGSGYYGKTKVQYRLLDTETAGLADFTFVLEIATTPIKVNDVIDQMLEKYGAKMEVADFADTNTAVLAPDYGTFVIETADTSLIWKGPWTFQFVAPGGMDLSAMLPESGGSGMDDIGDANPPA